MNDYAIKYLQPDNTSEFLQRLSSRLSGREDCKYTEFKVRISENHVTMDPLIYVFPDTHRRAERDKISALAYTLQTMNFKYNELSTGTYMYKHRDSQARKCRKWVKID